MKNKYFKRIAIVLVAVLLVILLFKCSTTQDQGNGIANSSKTTSETADSKADEDDKNSTSTEETKDSTVDATSKETDTSKVDSSSTDSSKADSSRADSSTTDKEDQSSVSTTETNDSNADKNDETTDYTEETTDSYTDANDDQEPTVTTKPSTTSKPATQSKPATSKPAVTTPPATTKPETSKPTTPTPEPSKPAHEHSYSIPITETVNHPAQTHEEPIYEDQQVVVKEAWDEEVKTYGQKCVDCGFFTTDPNEMVLHCFEHGHSCDNHCEIDIIYHEAVYETQKVQVGTETVVDKEAWTETVTTGYKCSCGAIK